jgi:lipopolysaccharide/colanic/teichoic acid biosynthesis glycosyltransferase
MRRMLAKRCFDIFVALMALVLLAPLLLVLAACVLVCIGRPVLFTQVRPGAFGKPFRLVKFRTMSNVRDASGALLPDAMRMTRFGTFLRASSLDELPELWNVLTGAMSVVGPRPLLIEYLPLYTSQQARRHEVRPGITGWAQINGRNALSWEERFALDVWYVDNRSFLLDLKIIVRTLGKVASRDGISHGADATMPRFTGSLR